MLHASYAADFNGIFEKMEIDEVTKVDSIINGVANEDDAIMNKNKKDAEEKNILMHVKKL